MSLLIWDCLPAMIARYTFLSAEDTMANSTAASPSRSLIFVRNQHGDYVPRPRSIYRKLDRGPQRRRLVDPELIFVIKTRSNSGLMIRPLRTQ